MLKGETDAMYIETLYDRIEEEYDHELAEKPEYKKLSEECRRIFDELQKGLNPEQREMLFTLEEAMNSCDILAWLIASVLLGEYPQGL